MLEVDSDYADGGLAFISRFLVMAVYARGFQSLQKQNNASLPAYVEIVFTVHHSLLPSLAF